MKCKQFIGYFGCNFWSVSVSQTLKWQDLVSNLRNSEAEPFVRTNDRGVTWRLSIHRYACWKFAATGNRLPAPRYFRLLSARIRRTEIAMHSPTQNNRGDPIRLPCLRHRPNWNVNRLRRHPILIRVCIGVSLELRTFHPSRVTISKNAVNSPNPTIPSSTKTSTGTKWG